MADRNAPRELAERFVQSRRYELEEPHLPSYEELGFSNDVGARSSSVGLHGNDGRLNEDSHGDEFLGYPDSNMNHRRPKRAKSRGNSVSRRESLQKRRLKEPRKSHKSTHGVSHADDSNGQASSHRSRSRGLSYSSNSITHKADDSTAGPSQRRARPKQILRRLKNPGPRELVNNFMQAHPHLRSAPTVSPRSLTTPVIIPQRRPGDTNRGFLRAYSPVLQDYGIGQDDFMDFLCTLDEANKVSLVCLLLQLADDGPGVIGPAGDQHSYTTYCVYSRTKRADCFLGHGDCSSSGHETAEYTPVCLDGYQKKKMRLIIPGAAPSSRR